MSTPETITVAAIGDLHVTDTQVHPYAQMFEEISDKADVLVLCGDLTNFGKITEAEILAADLGLVTIPVLGVLGNHDHESGLQVEVAKILCEAGMVHLDDQAVEVKGVGFAGVKGFIGGYGRGELAPFGETAIKVFVEEIMREARKLENALRTLRTERSMAVLHYSPIAETLAGEPIEIYPYLGSQRLADAIDRFDHVRAVVHGHAHKGVFEGRTMRGKPVYNCAQFVVRAAFDRPYALIEV